MLTRAHVRRYGGQQQAPGDFAGTLMAMASLPVANATVGCPGRCSSKGGGGARCLATLLALSGKAGLLRVDFFCLPDPSMVLASMFPTGADSFELAESDTLQTAQVRPQHTRDRPREREHARADHGGALDEREEEDGGGALRHCHDHVVVVFGEVIL